MGKEESGNTSDTSDQEAAGMEPGIAELRTAEPAALSARVAQAPDKSQRCAVGMATPVGSYLRVVFLLFLAFARHCRVGIRVLRENSGERCEAGTL